MGVLDGMLGWDKEGEGDGEGKKGGEGKESRGCTPSCPPRKLGGMNIADLNCSSGTEYSAPFRSGDGYTSEEGGGLVFL